MRHGHEIGFGFLGGEVYSTYTTLLYQDVHYETWDYYIAQRDYLTLDNTHP